MEKALLCQQGVLIDLDGRARKNILAFGVPEGLGEAREHLEKKKYGKKSLGSAWVSPLRQLNEHMDWGKTDMEKIGQPSLRCLIIMTRSQCLEIVGYLWKSTKSPKEKRAKVTLIHDKLYVDSAAYRWDSASNWRVELLHTG